MEILTGYPALRRIVAEKYEPNTTTKGGLVKPKTQKQREIDAAVCEAVVRFAFDHAGYGEAYLAPFGLEQELRDNT